MSYFGPKSTFFLTAWLYNIPGLLVGAGIVGLIWWLL
jgi:hypothetical protein